MSAPKQSGFHRLITRSFVNYLYYRRGLSKEKFKIRGFPYLMDALSGEA